MNQPKQVFLFLSVGGASAVVNFFSFYLAFNVCGMNYKIAASIAYALSVAAHFIGNHTITFREREPVDVSPRLKKYAVLLLVNYCVTLFTVTASVNWLHLSPYAGIVLAIAVTVIIGYMLSQKWVFKTV